MVFMRLIIDILMQHLDDDLDTFEERGVYNGEATVMSSIHCPSVQKAVQQFIRLSRYLDTDASFLRWIQEHPLNRSDPVRPLALSGSRSTSIATATSTAPETQQRESKLEAASRLSSLATSKSVSLQPDSPDPIYTISARTSTVKLIETSKSAERVSTPQALGTFPGESETVIPRASKTCCHQDISLDRTSRYDEEEVVDLKIASMNAETDRRQPRGEMRCYQKINTELRIIKTVIIFNTEIAATQKGTRNQDVLLAFVDYKTTTGARLLSDPISLRPILEKHGLRD